MPAGRSWSSRGGWVLSHPAVLVLVLLTVGFFALAPRIVVTEEELRQGDWTEYLVFDLASTRLRSGEQPGLFVRNEHEAGTSERLEQALGVEVGRTLRERLVEHVYSYPPFLAFLSSPISALRDYEVEVWLWYASIYGCLVAAVWISLRLPRQDAGGGPVAARVTGALAVLVSLRYLLAPLSNQQSDSIIFLFAVGGAFVLQRDARASTQALGGALLGAAAASKGPLLCALLWLGVSRRWWALASCAAFFGVWNLVPDLVFPPDSGEPRLVEWFRELAAPATAAGTSANLPGVWGEFNLQNQSLGGLLKRLFGEGRPEGAFPALVELSEGTTVALQAVLAMAVVALALPTIRELRGTAPHGAQAPDVARPLGAVFLLALLLSPMTSNAHFCVVALPVAIIVRDLARTKDAWLGMLALPALPFFFAGRDIIGDRAGDVIRFYGQGTCTAVFLLAALCRSACLRRSLERSDA